VDLYWTRITQTDYDNYAVELHCSLPWMRHQMAIYTRQAIPNEKTLEDIESYLKSVQLTIKNFTLIRQKKNCRSQKPPIMQRWHLSRYLYMDYNPVYVKPLVENENIWASHCIASLLSNRQLSLATNLHMPNLVQICQCPTNECLKTKNDH